MIEKIEKGFKVVASDGEEVGKVVGIEDSYLVVEKGFFFPVDYYIPTNVISSVEGEVVSLSVTKTVALAD